MTLFTKAKNTQAYAKVGLLGFAGSGKTYTATRIAIGLVDLMRRAGLDHGVRPAFFLDSHEARGRSPENIFGRTREHIKGVRRRYDFLFGLILNSGLRIIEGPGRPGPGTSGWRTGSIDRCGS